MTLLYLKRMVFHVKVVMFEHKERILLLSYVPKEGKNILMISSKHSSPEPSAPREDKKPQDILDYNKGKGGVDLMDSCISCKQKTNRYPLVIFFDIIDISVLNSYLMARENHAIASRSPNVVKIT